MMTRHMANATLLCDHREPLPVHRRILLYCYLGWLFDFYDLTLITYVLAATPLAKDLGIGRTEMSLVLGLSLAFTAAGGLFSGALADRYGRKPMLMGTIVVYSAGTLLSGLATDYWTLLLARAVTGLGVGGEWAVAQVLVGETVPAHIRGRYGAVLHSGASIGMLLATAVGGFAAPVIGWRWCFLLSALPALLVVLIRRDMPESDLWEWERQRTLDRRWQAPALFGPARPAWVDEVLEPAALRRSGLFDPVAVAGLRRRAEAGQITGFRENQAIVGILSAELWHHEFCRGARGAPPLAIDGADVCLVAEAGAPTTLSRART